MTSLERTEHRARSAARCAPLRSVCYVGSMGRRRGRTTKSSRPGRGRYTLPSDGPVDWPGLTGPSVFTFHGALQQTAAVSRNLARATGAQGAIARFLWCLAFPPAAAAVLTRDLFRAIARRMRS
jgi:hypothetical protein